MAYFLYTTSYPVLCSIYGGTTDAGWHKWPAGGYASWRWQITPHGVLQCRSGGVREVLMQTTSHHYCSCRVGYVQLFFWRDKLRNMLFWAPTHKPDHYPPVVGIFIPQEQGGGGSVCWSAIIQDWSSLEMCSPSREWELLGSTQSIRIAG